MSRDFYRCLGVLIIFIPGAVAQTTSFEVASVRLSARQDVERGSTGIPSPITRSTQGRIAYTHVTLKGVLSRAYDMRPPEISGPGWLDEKFYDINAKIPPGTTLEQVRLMLQALLAERFRMELHWDTQQKAGYALVLGRGPLRLKPATPGSDGEVSRGESLNNGDGVVRLGFNGVTLDDLAKSLTFLVARPIVNLTHVPGQFDMKLECSPDSLPGLGQLTPQDPASPGASVVYALRQLGLDLNAQKVSVKRLVVDSADSQPAEN